MVEKIKKTKKKLRSPSAFAGLFVVIAIMAALTWIIPSGQYQTQADPNDPEAMQALQQQVEHGAQEARAPLL